MAKDNINYSDIFDGSEHLYNIMHMFMSMMQILMRLVMDANFAYHSFYEVLIKLMFS